MSFAARLAYDFPPPLLTSSGRLGFDHNCQRRETLFAGSTVEFLFPFNADGVCIGGRGDRIRGESGGEKKRRTGPEGDLARYL